jgi:succinyl-CoA synthetase beta subunit
VMDRGSKRIVVMASSEGGVEIEEVAKTKPEAIVKIAAHPTLGLHPYQARELAFGIGITDGKQARQFAQIASALYRAYMATDASLAEINPLVVLPGGALQALDSKIVLDDSALFRHADLEAMRDASDEPEAERRAREADITFIKLDGNIGCMVNGAGLAMATMDIIKLAGSEPANFLDVGGGASAEQVKNAFRIILSDKNVKAILINIFGGIMRGDRIAEGVVSAAREIGLPVPVVVRLEGTNVELGKEILAKSGLPLITADGMWDAAQKVVAAAKGQA